jgi:hypothetical protein
MTQRDQLKTRIGDPRRRDCHEIRTLVKFVSTKCCLNFPGSCTGEASFGIKRRVAESVLSRRDKGHFPVMKSPGTDDRGLRALEGRGTSFSPMRSTFRTPFRGPAPRQGVLVGNAPPRWLHHRLKEQIENRRDSFCLNPHRLRFVIPPLLQRGLQPALHLRYFRGSV